MSEGDLKEGLKNNWYLFLLLVAVIGGAIYLGLGSGESTEIPRAANPPESMTQDAVASGEEPVRSSFFKDEVTSKEIARSQIAEYEKKYLDDPRGEEASLYLRRTGNLYYSSLQDWDKAAEAYEELLLNYPDDPKNYEIYPNLAQCYENLNDRSNAISIYRKMLDVFPEGSQYRLLAMEKLNH